MTTGMGPIPIHMGSRTMHAPSSDAVPLEPDIPSCDACGAEYAGNLQCSKCESAFYCSRECQVDHWKRGHHKQNCPTLQKQCQEIAAVVLSELDQCRGWDRLDGAGAYRAAVQLGLHKAILDLLQRDVDDAMKRYRQGKIALSYTQYIMSVLFRGQRVEGRAKHFQPRFGCLDGGRIKAFCKCDPNAVDVWFDASIQMLKVPLDSVVYGHRLRGGGAYGGGGPNNVHTHAHQAARDVWAGWVMVLTNPTASQAVLLPVKGEPNDPANLTRAKTLVTKMRNAVKYRCSIDDDRDPGSVVEANLNTVAAMMDQRYREYGVQVDFVGHLNLKGDHRRMFYQVAIPNAKATIAKGGNLTTQEANAVVAKAARETMRS